MIEIEPTFHGAYWITGCAYMIQGNYNEAADELEKSMKLGGTPTVEAYLGCAYGLAGRREEALNVVNRFL